MHDAMHGALHDAMHYAMHDALHAVLPQVRCPRCRDQWGLPDSGLQQYEYTFMMQARACAALAQHTRGVCAARLLSKLCLSWLHAFVPWIPPLRSLATSPPWRAPPLLPPAPCGRVSRRTPAAAASAPSAA